MIAISFDVIGAITGHMIMGYGLSVISMLGIVALAGIVVNDTLVLVMYANEKIKERMDATTAIIEAGLRMFRPIILTTLTIFIGLTPLLLEPSLQSRFLIPMAISLAFSVLTSTLISLVLVPSLFSILEGKKVGS
jgi:multidrug efflux pump subunit AcrB